MATGTIRNADLIVPETWASKSLGYLPQYLNLLNTIQTDKDFEDEQTASGRVIHITKRGGLVANDKTPGSDVTLQRVTETQVPVTLSTHKEVTFAPEDVARMFQRRDLFSEYMEDAAAVVAESAEASIAALYASAGIIINAQGLSGTNLENKYFEARRRLITNKVRQNATLYAYESQFLIEDLLKTDVMRDASKYGSNRPVTDGAVGRYAGFDHFESQAVGVSGSPSVFHNMLYSKDAMVIAPRPLTLDAEIFGGAKQGRVNDPQTGFSMRVTMSYQHLKLAPLVTIDAVWGVAVTRADHLIDFQTT